MLRMAQLALADQRVLIREDFNVPIEHGEISSTRRLEAALPTLRLALAQRARVMVMSHLGRPREGVYSETDSLAPVAAWLGSQLGQPVRLARDYLDGVAVDAGELVLLENVRMNVGEGADDPALAARYAALCDVFVMDAFGTAHRAQASTHGVIRAARIACGGPLLMAEIDALARALEAPARPLLAIVGGSKVSTKLTLLGRLLGDVDALIVGGGIANTFIAASGHAVGRSLYEPELVAEAQRLLVEAAASGKDIPLPIDVLVSTELSAQAPARVTPVSEIEADELIVDIGPQTAALYRERILAAGTVVWNGPVGVFEIDRFGHGTRAVAEAIADHRGLSVAGGGDTLAAIDKYGVEDRIEYVSTGGGAFLEFLEGQELPAIAALKAAAQKQHG